MWMLLAGLLIGLTFGFLIEHWYQRKYDGRILVDETEEKITYSLEILEDPENLKHKKRVLFKVESSELSDRE